MFGHCKHPMRRDNVQCDVWGPVVHPGGQRTQHDRTAGITDARRFGRNQRLKIDDVEKIIRVCPKKRQTLFFSATISPRIDKLTRKYMNNPVKVSVNNHVDPSKLKQQYYTIPKNGKLSLLVHLLQEPFDLAMVFCNTRRTTDFVAKTLRGNGVDAMAIHGGFEQNKRQKTIAAFNKGRITVLVCTDVAARGIHIDNVSHVYNYEIPRDSTDYVHRIGRTARAGEKGKVVNFVSERDMEDFAKIKRNYRTFDIKKLDAPKVEKIVPVSEEKRFRSKYSGKGTPKRKFSHGKKFSRDPPRGGSRSRSSRAFSRDEPSGESGRSSSKGRFSRGSERSDSQGTFKAKKSFSKGSRKGFSKKPKFSKGRAPKKSFSRNRH